jgi:hypothetical protein
LVMGSMSGSLLARNTEQQISKADPERPAPIRSEDQKLFKQIDTLLDKVEKNFERVQALRWLAELQAAYGDQKTSRLTFQRAVKILEKWPEGKVKVIEYRDQAMAMIDAGLYEDALRIASTLQQSPDDKTAAAGELIVCGVAFQLVKNGKKN